MIAIYTHSAKADPALLIFAGPDHKQFLGCLNCSADDPLSVNNTDGAYGSSNSTTSIFDNYTQFGSEYGNYSPCNEYPLDAPVIVDSQGNYYGRLTISEDISDSELSRSYIPWLKNQVCI
jgi:hypothetical protein